MAANDNDNTADNGSDDVTMTDKTQTSTQPAKPNNDLLNDIQKGKKLKKKKKKAVQKDINQQNDANNNNNDNHNSNKNYIPAGYTTDYTMKSIINGQYGSVSYDRDYNIDPKTKPLLLPFQDQDTWNLLVETFKTKQPAIGGSTNKTKQPAAEIIYLSTLFNKLGSHPATKFCQWLINIRRMSLANNHQTLQNGVEIYNNFFNKTLPFIKQLILLMPKLFNKYKKPDNIAPNKFEIGSQCEVYSDTQSTWFTGKIIKITTDNEGEWIHVEYGDDNDKKVKQIQKLSQYIRSVAVNNNDNDQKQNNSNDADIKQLSLSYMNPYSNAIVSFTRGQIASILACCWFGIKMYENCTFRYELHRGGQPAKLECYIRYFEFVRSKGINSDWFNKETVTIWRRTLNINQLSILKHQNLLNNNTKLTSFDVYDTGCIEDQCGQLNADFANEYIGGGVLEGGNVQEEIRFTVNTECIISKWLNPLPMKHNECIIIFGSQQFFNYSGYGSSFSFNGYRDNPSELFYCNNKPNRLGSCVMIGIDALYLMYPRNQCKINFMIREIMKSYCGYSITNNDIGHNMNIISTGNWGCGIFRGDPQVKALLQWISASLSNRSIAYYTFNDKRVGNGKLNKFVKKLKKQNVTIGQLWKALSNPQLSLAYKQGHNVFSLLPNFL